MVLDALITQMCMGVYSKAVEVIIEHNKQWKVIVVVVVYIISQSVS